MESRSNKVGLLLLLLLSEPSITKHQLMR